MSDRVTATHGNHPADRIGQDPQKLPILVITGPTASGKSDLAVRLAQEFSGEILSCDSVQVYRHMDIGSAKISPADRRSIPHHGLDLCMPDRPFNVGEFASYAVRTVEEVCVRKRRPLFVVGGTGFYLKLFYGPLIDSVQIDRPIVDRVEAIEREAGPAGLIRALEIYNDDLSSIDLHNIRRLRRYLERCMATGKSIVLQRKELANRPCLFGEVPKFTVLLTADASTIMGRILDRTEWMIGAGLVEEVRHLLTLNIQANYSAAHAIGYREVLERLDGPIDLADLRDAIVADSRRLVRKQKTWFRTQLTADRLVDTANLDYGTLRDAIADFLGSCH